jgi:hypothetical protein
LRRIRGKEGNMKKVANDNRKNVKVREKKEGEWNDI